ncbi:hypothetical protein ACA910_012738 [Epithemia clementina (nom. ined.)]
MMMITNCWSFNQLQRYPSLTPWCIRKIHSSSSSSTSTTSTALRIDLGGFFGGGNKKSRSSDDPALTDGGVAEIMQSMTNLESAQRMGKLTTSLLQELQSSIVEGSAQDGKVKVYFDCQQKPVRVSIDESYYADAADAAELAASLTVAMKDGHEKSIEKMTEKMKSLYSEFGLSTS